MNTVILIGHVGQDPKVTTFDNGGEIVTFSLATKKRGFTTQDGRTIPEKTSWHQIVIRGSVVKVAKEYVSKGSQIAIKGELTYREWDRDNGEKVRVAEVVVNSADGGELTLTGSNPNGNGKQNTYNEQAQGYNPNQQQTWQQAPQPQYQAPPQGQPQYQQAPPPQQYQQVPPQGGTQQRGGNQQPQYQPQPQGQPQYQATPQQGQQPNNQQYYSGGSNADNLPF